MEKEDLIKMKKFLDSALEVYETYLSITEDELAKEAQSEEESLGIAISAAYYQGRVDSLQETRDYISLMENINAQASN